MYSFPKDGRERRTMVQLHTEQAVKLNQEMSQSAICDKNVEAPSMKIMKYSDLIYSVGTANEPFGSYEGQRNFLNIPNDFSASDIEIKRKYMTVMSNTMSIEDYNRLCEDGVNPLKTDVSETVSSLDKIKAKLLEAGVVIKGYNDDLSREELENITGSPLMADAIEDAFAERGLPLNREMVEETKKAIDRASEIEKITDGMCEYLLKNAIEPTLDHLYRVRFSGASSFATSFAAKGGYYLDESGYLSKQGEQMDYANLEGRIHETIENCGLEVSELTILESKWLIENGIIYNERNLSILHRLWALDMPMDLKDLADAAANAILKGHNPKDAIAWDRENYATQAIRIKQEVEAISDEAIQTVVGEGKPLNIRNLKLASISFYSEVTAVSTVDSEALSKARLSLEQVRLKMTVEGNMKMLRRGIRIETTALSELVNTLEALEDETNRALFGSEESKENLRIKGSLYRETNREIAELPFLPAGAVGRALSENGFLCVSKVYKAGIAMQKAYESAADSYEKLGTEIRSDLGDDIQKAFENIDDLLDEFGLEKEEENRRAVRIISYSRMELTIENVEMVRREDANLKSVIELMTPQRVLQLIREGKNPLEESLDNLKEALTRMEDDPSVAMEDYARFLGRLENRNEITENERNAYIGIYRLLRQYEKSDGAALGSLLGENAKVSLKNILSAIRSGKNSGLDIKISEAFGEINGSYGYQYSISEQIMQGFLDASEETPEETTAYRQEAFQEMKEALKASNETVEELLHYGQEITPENLAAMESILSEKDASHWKLFRGIKFADALKNYKESFTDEESVKEAFDEVTSAAKEELTNAVNEDGVTKLDLKNLTGAYKKLVLFGGMIREENYEVPVEINEEVTSIRLKILHKAEGKGTVISTFESAQFGAVSAQFYFVNDELQGLIAGDNKDGLEALKNAGIEEDFMKAGLQTTEFYYIHSESLDTSRLFTRHDAKETDKSNTKTLFQVAKTFIETVERVGKR